MLIRSNSLFSFSRFIKIANWNINGLRSVVSKNKLQQYINESNPDILCMNQTRIDSLAYTKTKIEELTPNTYHYLNQCKVKKGYSGVGVITKIQPSKVFHDFEYMQKYQNLSEEEKQFNLEGRLLTLEYNDFYLLNVYKPNAGDMLMRLDYRLRYDDLFNKYINVLNQNKPTIVVGDFNVAPKPIDLTYPKKNLGNAGFTLEQRQQFQNLLKLDMIDGFRHLYPSKIQYTWWSNSGQSRQRNIGWRIDHIVFNKKLIESVVDVKIRKDVLGSDHCPIEAVIDLDSCM